MLDNIPNSFYFPSYDSLVDMAIRCKDLFVFLNKESACILIDYMNDEEILKRFMHSSGNLSTKELAIWLIKNINYSSKIGIDLINNTLSEEEILESIKSNISVLDHTGKIRFIINNLVFSVASGKIEMER